MVWLFVFVVYILWLVKRKVERTGIFNKIYTWLLFGIVSVLAYGLLAAIISFLALELSDNIITTLLYLPWVFFSLCIYKVGRTILGLTKEFGITETKESEKKILESERKKIIGTLRLLESEFKEGILSKKAYNEMKLRNEVKLADAEKKLKEMG